MPGEFYHQGFPRGQKNENRLVEVKKNRAVIAAFVLDRDGKQVKGTVNGVTTYSLGTYNQKQGTLVTKYYYAGAERIAMRQGGVLYYIFGDRETPPKGLRLTGCPWQVSPLVYASP